MQKSISKDLKNIIDKMYQHRGWLLAVSVIVVFITTYLLILPAFTLEKDEAAKQGGIDVPSVEQTVSVDEDAAENDEAVDPEASPEQNEATMPAEVESNDADGADDSIEAPAVSSEVDSLKFEGDKYTVSVIDNRSALPGNTEVKVSEIDKKTDSNTYKQYYDDALKAVQDDESGSNVTSFSFARIYDISLVADGEEIKNPDDAVSVRIEYDKELGKYMSVGDRDNLRVVHFAENKNTGEIEPELLDKENIEVNTDKKDNLTDTTFETEGFSVFAIVYTVDFSYSVDGETFDYSIDGDSSVSLRFLLQSLNVINDDEDTDVNELDLFMNEIDTVEFTDSELIGIEKADTEEGEAADWTLTSLKPFDTEESLTITMKNGDVFEVKVTDAQEISDASTVDVNKTYIISYQDNNGYHVLKTDGSVETFTNSQAFINTGGGMDRLGSDYQWTFYYVFTEKDRETSMNYTYYFIRPVTDKTKTIALNEVGEDLIQTGTNNVAVIPQAGGGFVFLGYNHSEGTHIELGYSNGSFESFNHDAEPDESNIIRIFEQEPLARYSFTVKTDDADKGMVSGRNEAGTVLENVSQFIAQTNDGKKNNNQIRAVTVNHSDGQGHNKWIFDYWDLDGEKLNNVGATIQAGTIDIPKNGSVLTAHFKQNPAYIVPDSEKEGTDIESMRAWLTELKNRNVPLNADGTKKTAEVYDYENRVYRVDLTAQSSLTTFDGTIDLGFMIDVSGSMQFPSELHDSSAVTGLRDLSTINNRGGYGNRTQGERWGLNTNNTYYIITDAEGTATVCYLYYWQNQWWLCDASKNRFAGQYDSNNDGRFDPATGWSVYGNKNYNDSYYTTHWYVIQEAGDRVTQADFNNPTSAAILNKHGLHVGDPKTRAYYLELSMNGTLDELDEILDVLSIANDSSKNPDVKIAWNTFRNFLPNGSGQIQHNFVSASSGIDLSYDVNTYGGGTSTDAALLDAAGVNRNDINNRYSDTDRKNWDTDNNVSHRYTLNASSGFQWEQSATKYAVLITDGAPQRNGKSITRRYVTEAAQQLKNRGVNLITVGLGIDNVTSGKILMYDIADTLSNEKMFYSAKTGDELEDVLLQIISKIMVDAAVQGNVTDTISQPFYPVDKATFKPLAPGQMIDLDGNITTDASKPHGTITYDSTTDTYGVEWTSQEFTWDGWHGSVYVKAKEDLLGGNAVETNDGDAVVEAKTYKTNPNGPAIQLVDKKYINNDPSQGEDPKYNRFASCESPRVNINELSFTKNDTEWTVYLGTNVDPKQELRGLYDNIKVEQVIKDGKAEDKNNDELPDTVKYSNGDTDNNWYPIAPDSITDSRESEGTGDKNCFYLKDLIEVLAENSAAGTYPWWDYSNHDIDFDKFLELALTENGFDIPYQVYGIEDNSYINIKLDKVIISGEEDDIINGSPHDTTVVGDEVEKYTLRVLYSPDYDVLPKGQGGSSIQDFHTGTYGTIYQGHAAGTEDSINTHIVNVFVKSLHITKTDFDWEQELNGAEFVLVRKSGSDEEIVSTLSNDGAVFTIDNADISLKDGDYYIRETTAPAGYNKLSADIPVSLILTDTYIEKPGSTPQSDEPDSGEIYDWKETALLTLGMDYTRIVDENGDQIPGVSADSETNTIYYKIMNTSGAELPQAGGIGTTIFYVLGSLLVVISSIYMISKRRIRNN
ncbi:MAG: VWA domain-containing protein [Clostridiales bacterium]|nr:VWA domain-containing protein [Clostridiales bacterium]